MSSSYGSLEAASEDKVVPVISRDEENGSDKKVTIGPAPTDTKTDFKSWHYTLLFGASIAIIAAVLFLVLFDVGGLGFGLGGGDDDDDDDDDGGDDEINCKINNPVTSDALYETTLDRIDLDIEKYPTALCNDGSPGAYYFKAAPEGGQESTWIIMLEGSSKQPVAVPHVPRDLHQRIRPVERFLDSPSITVLITVLINDRPFFLNHSKLTFVCCVV
jgi:hypothetical protein